MCNQWTTAAKSKIFDKENSFAETPYSNITVIATRNYFVLPESKTGHRTSVTYQGGRTSTVFTIPNLDGPVMTATYETHFITSNSPHPLDMSKKRLHGSSCGNIPSFYSIIEAPRNEHWLQQSIRF